jgi:hypothetical protein
MARNDSLRSDMNPSYLPGTVAAKTADDVVGPRLPSMCEERVRHANIGIEQVIKSRHIVAQVQVVKRVIRN